MFPSEMVILMAIAGSGDRLLTRPIDVIGEYISYLCDSLIRRGYLKKHNPSNYQLASQGRECISEFIHGNKSRVKDSLKMLRQFGIEVSQEMAKYTAIGVK
ncbi:hypothetical protein ACFLX7_04350 [Chloroflexota bacterium]